MLVHDLMTNNKRPLLTSGVPPPTSFSYCQKKFAFDVYYFAVRLKRRTPISLQNLPTRFTSFSALIWPLPVLQLHLSLYNLKPNIFK